MVNPAISEKWKKVKSLSHVQLFVTPWTVAYQLLPFMGFSRQEYWSAISEVPIKQTKHVPTKSETYWVWMFNIFIAIRDTGNTRSAAHVPKSCLHDGFCPICSVYTANEVAAFSVCLGSPKRLSDEIPWVCLSMLIKRDFFGGPVVENPPVCAGDVGLFDPWLGKIPCASGQLSLCITATEACAPRATAPQQEKPLRWEAHTPRLEGSPCSPPLEKAYAQKRRPSAARQTNRNVTQELLACLGRIFIKSPPLGDGRSIICYLFVQQIFVDYLLCAMWCY